MWNVLNHQHQLCFPISHVFDPFLSFCFSSNQSMNISLSSYLSIYLYIYQFHQSIYIHLIYILFQCSFLFLCPPRPRRRSLEGALLRCTCPSVRPSIPRIGFRTITSKILDGFWIFSIYMQVDNTKIQVKFEFGVRRSKVTAHYIFKLVSAQ